MDAAMKDLVTAIAKANKHPQPAWYADLVEAHHDDTKLPAYPEPVVPEEATVADSTEG